MFDTLLVANRGEIARRILRTARRMGVRTVAVYSDADAELPFVLEADKAVALGAAAPAESYLDIPRLIDAARRTGAQAIHPGYGFLSENAEFADAVADAGLVWVGPAAETIAAMGNKVNARNLMADAGVPVSAGSREPITEIAEAVGEAERIGYPVMLKPAAGGGGLGMAVAADGDELASLLPRSRAMAERGFGDATVLLERFLPAARHVEIQILGLADGRVLALGDRECSVQRRHQKLVEETPSPGVGTRLRADMFAAAVRAGEAVGYTGAGTVECLVDPTAQEFVFLEMNTRLQVEHAVTEAVTGLDLVQGQLRIAAGEAAGVDHEGIKPAGHAVELRVNAEDPVRFLPGPGPITSWCEPTGAGVRVDAGYTAGTTVTPHYDSLLAKLIVHGADRDQALHRARHAVAGFAIGGPKHNLPFFAELLDHPEFVSGDYDTGIVARMRGT